MFGLNDHRPVIIIALLAIVISGALIFSNLQSPPRGLPEKKAVQGQGAALAQAAIEAVADHGQIVVVTYFVNQSGTPAAVHLKTQWAGFQTVLRAHPGVVVTATERVELGLDPAEAAAKGMDTASSYLALVAKYPNADAIVSLIDAPNLDPEDLNRLPKHLPKVVTLANVAGVPNLRRLFAAGVLSAAILPRWIPVMDPAKPRQPAEWFSRNFQIVTNVDMLPPPPVLN